MNQLVATLYEMTLAMNKAFELENYEELDKLLNDRHDIMAKVDQIKSEDFSLQYSKEAIATLEKIFIMDQALTMNLSGNLEHTRSLINRSKMNKQVSKKFLPYSNQMSGIFVDAKK